MIIFKCPKCDVVIEADDQAAGISNNCPSCSEPLTVPVATIPPTAFPAPSAPPLLTIARPAPMPAIPAPILQQLKEGGVAGLHVLGLLGKRIASVTPTPYCLPVSPPDYVKQEGIPDQNAQPASGTPCEPGAASNPTAVASAATALQPSAPKLDWRFIIGLLVIIICTFVIVRAVSETKAPSPSSAGSAQVGQFTQARNPCERCRGSGQLVGQCSQCNGDGTIQTNLRGNPTGGGSFRVVCPKCGGTGQMPIPCNRCKGSGESH
jgi:predicted nucleic acid binding AN1-type Zn finger protein